MSIIHLISNGTVILPDALLKNANLAIEGSKISYVGKFSPGSSADFRINARGCFISPGFIDSHIHGDPAEIFENEIKSGTTSIVIAESCAPLGAIYKKIGRIKGFAKSEQMLGPNVLGVRLEGPYISKEKRGAQDERYIKLPVGKEVLEIIKKTAPLLRIMTVAPELKGVIPTIKRLKEHGVIASMGHSNATYEEALNGVKAGARHVTHLFNAMSGLDRRDPGVAGAALFDDRVTVEIIPDLTHVHEMLFRMALRLKGASNIVLVTDSIKADPPPGAKKDGVVYRFRNGRIAGSSLTMIEALRNAVGAGALTIVEAVKFISINPAKLLGVFNKKGSLKAGKDADVVIFDDKFDIKMTIINGRIAYRKKGF